MGNLCSTSSDRQYHANVPLGRRLGGASSVPAPTNATSTFGGVINTTTTTTTTATPAPTKSKNPKPKPTGPGRTLGSTSPATGAGSVDAREAAARAAEARNQATRAAAAKGTLTTQLDADKRKTRNQQLQEISAQRPAQQQLVWD